MNSEFKNTPMDVFDSEVDRMKTIEKLRSMSKSFSRLKTPVIDYSKKPIINRKNDIIAQSDKGTIRKIISENSNPNPKKTIKRRNVGGKKIKRKSQKRYK